MIGILCSLDLSAQVSFSGFVLDATTKEALNGAHIYLVEEESSQTANESGYFSLSIPDHSGRVSVITSYIGYRTDTSYFELVRDTLVKINLEAGLQLAQIEVRGSSEKYRSTDHFIRLQTQEISNIPSLTGETDILKVFQLLPGIAGGLEGNGGLHVRGGSPDQNLILLDGTPLYYAYHLGGFVSTFNPASIKNTTIYHDYIPAKFSGRLSSVIDTRLKDGGKDQWRKDLNIGLLATSFSANGPISQKVTASFSIRRTLFDILSNAYLKYIDKQDFGAGYYILDSQAKIKIAPNARNSFYISYYAGVDKSYLRDNAKNITFRELPDEKFNANAENSAAWGNKVIALSWNHIPNGNWALRFDTKYADFFFDDRSLLDVRSPNKIIVANDQRLLSKINDIQLSLDAQKYFGNKITGEIGVALHRRSFTPFRQTIKDINEYQDIDTVYSDGISHSPEYKIYNEWTWDDIIKNVSVKGGCNISLFSVPLRNFLLVDPRLLFNYQRGNWSVSASYMLLNQFLHFLSNSSSGFPADLWVPSTANVRPQRSRQIWLEIKREMKIYELSVGFFSKKFNHLIRLNTGQSFFTPGDLASKLISGGEGKARGLELLLRKHSGRISGWLAYTLSENERQFDGFNNDQWFPYLYDRRHDISLVVKGEISDKISFGGTWMFQSGHPLTFPNFRYQIQSDDLTDRFQSFNHLTDIYDVTSVNNILSRSFHKLDISFEFRRTKKRGTNTWKLGIYNVYNRLNPYYYYIQHAPDNGAPQLKQLSIFPIIPFFNFHKNW